MCAMKYVYRTSLPLALAVALTLTACSKTPEERIMLARDAYEQNDYPSARNYLVEVVNEQADNVEALALLAHTYVALLDAARAKKTLGQLNRLGKLPKDANVLLGEAEIMDGRFDAALAAVANDTSAPAFRVRALANLGKKDSLAAEQAFSLGERAPGKRAPLLADYAHFQLERGKLVEARRLAALAAQEQPRVLASYLASADVAAADSQLTKALALFDAGLKFYPQSQAALLGKIRVLDALGRLNDTRPLVASALAYDGNDPSLIYLDARLDALDGNWQKVRDKLQVREASLESQPDANLLYAKALMQLGQTEHARWRLSGQLRRSPSDRRARLLLGESKLLLGRPAEAAQTLSSFASLPDATSQELGLLARALKAAGDPQAEIISAKARQAAGNRLLSQVATADKAIRTRDWATAIIGYEAVMKQTDGTNVLVLNNLAYAYSQVGNQAKALGLAERALKLAPDNASVMDTMGWLLHRSGKDRQRSIALLRAAAAKAPGNSMIASHLKQAENS